jgi:GR25 family glycosyltransferase involved in LPS biosynthesis
VTTSTLDTPRSAQKNADRLAWIWRAFDKIYCISLANRPDRYEHARAQFAKVGLLDLVEFVIVDKHPTDSEQGIYESHLTCLRAGLAAGAQKIAIFEDDIVFTRFSPQRLRRAINFMDSSADWDAFFFGCFVNSARKTSFRSVIKINYRCVAHGYAVNRDFALRLVETEFKGVSYDDFLRSIAADRFYAIYPAFAFQSNSPTDNDKLREVDRARRLAGGLHRLQRWNEFCNHWLWEIVAAHIVAAILLVIFIVHHYR